MDIRATRTDSQSDEQQTQTRKDKTKHSSDSRICQTQTDGLIPITGCERQSQRPHFARFDEVNSCVCRLRQIWQAADRQQRNYLDRDDFFVVS